jgi:hypothetical protein
VQGSSSSITLLVGQTRFEAEEIVPNPENRKEIQTDGDYELRFSNGPSEIGHFTVDCDGICG